MKDSKADDAVPTAYAFDQRPEAKLDIWIDVLVGLVCVLPLLLTAHLPLTDLPNHLARQYILRDWASSPTLQTFYWVRWDVVPNLALELFVLAARQVMSIDLAVRAFCIATVLLLYLGTRLINRRLSDGRSRIYRVAPLLCYGGPFQYGFLSYCFGVGLSLLCFGLYLRLRTKPVIAAAFLFLSGFLLLLCHLAAFGLFALAVGASEVSFGVLATGSHRRRLPVELLKRQILPVTSLVAALAIFSWLGAAADQLQAVNATRFLFRFSTLHEKAQAIYAITSFASPWLEVGLLGLALAGLAAALLTRSVRFHAVGLTVSVVMLVIWLATPSIAFGAAFIDYRLPWAIAFFVLAGLVPNRVNLPLRVYFSGLAVARIALIAVLWVSWEPTLTALDAALGKLPNGVRLTVVEGHLPNNRLFRTPDLGNVASYVVARRQGFETGIFASLSGQILHFQPHYQELWEKDDYARVIPDSLDHVEPDYDYALVMLPALAHIAPGVSLTCEDHGPNFAIYRINKAPAGAGQSCPD